MGQFSPIPHYDILILETKIAEGQCIDSRISNKDWEVELGHIKVG